MDGPQPPSADRTRHRRALRAGASPDVRAAALSGLLAGIAVLVFVHGVRGLYVADASIMPAITRGNINLPTAMIGARIAAGLLGIEPAHALSRHMLANR